jgi:hypothetical protein
MATKEDVGYKKAASPALVVVLAMRLMTAMSLDDMRLASEHSWLDAISPY